jgi:hypothetical protein
MLNLLLDHTPAFVAGELILALCLGTLGFSLLGAVRERYAVRVRAPAMRDRSSR